MSSNVDFGDEEEASARVFDALALLETDPLVGLFRVIACIQHEHESGDPRLESLERDLLVQTLVRRGVFLDVAEAVALNLVASVPDATNLELLASVFQRQGRPRDAAGARERAATAGVRPREPEYDEFVKQALKKYQR